MCGMIVVRVSVSNQCEAGMAETTRQQGEQTQAAKTYAEAEEIGGRPVQDAQESAGVLGCTQCNDS